MLYALNNKNESSFTIRKINLSYSPPKQYLSLDIRFRMNKEIIYKNNKKNIFLTQLKYITLRQFVTYIMILLILLMIKFNTLIHLLYEMNLIKSNLYAILYIDHYREQHARRVLNIT